MQRQSSHGVDRVEQVPMQRLLIKMKDGVTDQEELVLRQVLERNRCYGCLGSYKIKAFSDKKKKFDMARDIIGYIFSVVTGIAMFICFFSLMAAMHANIHDQKKEIAVLRAVGASGFYLYRVYIYEAAVLVISSGCLGMGIGATVGYTMALQRSTFLALPLSFAFPFGTARFVLFAALAFGILSTAIPLRRLLARRVYTILREAQ